MSGIFKLPSEFKFDWTYREFKIRTVQPQHQRIPERIIPYIELIKFTNAEKTEHIRLAYYRVTEEGGNWVFEGQRPFLEMRATDLTPIWKQLWICALLFEDWADMEGLLEKRE